MWTTCAFISSLLVIAPIIRRLHGRDNHRGKGLRKQGFEQTRIEREGARKRQAGREEEKENVCVCERENQHNTGIGESKAYEFGAQIFHAFYTKMYH